MFFLFSLNKIDKFNKGKITKGKIKKGKFKKSNKFLGIKDYIELIKR